MTTKKQVLSLLMAVFCLILFQGCNSKETRESKALQESRVIIHEEAPKPKDINFDSKKSLSTDSKLVFRSELDTLFLDSIKNLSYI